MTSSEQIQEIEVSIQESKKFVDKMESLIKLSTNKDFIKVVEEGYFQEEASRLVLLKADPSMQKAEDQAGIMNGINAIGHFRQYLHTVIQLGRMMEKSIKDSEDTREEILAESLHFEE